jgi:predicted ATP-grasp superfamily ATP-dependent carboligase
LELRLFGHVGLRGVAKVEFKYHHRDSLLEVVECNARFTAGNALLVASRYDLGLFVYNGLDGAPGPELKGRAYELGLHCLIPEEGFRAFLALRAEGRMGALDWLRSVAHRQVLPYFRWDDPVPSIVMAGRFARRAGRRAARTGGIASPTASR